MGNLIILILGFVMVGYLFAGIGFSIASWLQHVEIELKKNENPNPYFSRLCVVFILLWPCLALYCHRSNMEIKKGNEDE